MEPNPQQPRSISEIGHLFLSSVRQRQGGNSPRPVRVPPPRADAPPKVDAPPPSSVDLTPEEYAQVARHDPQADPRDAARPSPIPPISAVIVQHLNGKAHQRVREYARHLAAGGQRLGVIEVDASELILSRFERSIEPADQPAESQVLEHFDHRLACEAMEEMNWDIDRWLLVLPNSRSPEARALLNEVDRWIVLATCDHDGVVSCYRTLKGLAGERQPRLSLALIDAASEVVAQRIFKKLNNVCVQFLGIELEAEEPVRSTRAVSEHVAVHCRLTHDKAQLAAGAQWLMLADFLARARSQAALAAESAAEPNLPAPGETTPRDETPTPDENASPDQAPPARHPPLHLNPAPDRSPMPQPQPTSPDQPQPFPAPFAAAGPAPAMNIAADAPAAMSIAVDAPDEVIDLAGDSASDESIVLAVLNHSSGQMIPCPLRPPSCPSASLAVTRERSLVLVAVAQKGLRDINAIAHGYRWLVENRSLIAMALPQFAIDAHQHPRLTLLVDHADSSAQVLAPMLQNGSVTVQAYRKLRWHGRTGLLLEAA